LRFGSSRRNSVGTVIRLFVSSRLRRGRTSSSRDHIASLPEPSPAQCLASVGDEGPGVTAVLEREVSARNASGAQLRIRAAGFPAVKTMEDFGWDTQSAIRPQVGALTSGAFLTEARNVVLLGPPGTGFPSSKMPRTCSSKSSHPATNTPP
jgi:hypothetical protein